MSKNRRAATGYRRTGTLDLASPCTVDYAGSTNPSAPYHTSVISGDFAAVSIERSNVNREKGGGSSMGARSFT